MFSGRWHPPIITGCGWPGDRRPVGDFLTRTVLRRAITLDSSQDPGVRSAVARCEYSAGRSSPARVGNGRRRDGGAAGRCAHHGARRVDDLQRAVRTRRQAQAARRAVVQRLAGAAQLEILRPLQTTLRVLALLPTANVTLGPARTDFSARMAKSAVSINIGITSRIMFTGRFKHHGPDGKIPPLPPRLPDAARPSARLSQAPHPRGARTPERASWLGDLGTRTARDGQGSASHTTIGCILSLTRCLARHFRARSLAFIC